MTTKQVTKAGQEEGHGWLGIKFQVHPHGEASTIIIHVRMLDWETPRQQEAVGIIGVNLIHGAFYQCTDPTTLIGSLLDGLTKTVGTLKENSREHQMALARLTDAIGMSAQMIAKMQTGEEQLLRLQESLNQNLGLLANSATFKVTLLKHDQGVTR